MVTESIMDAIASELARARAKFPSSYGSVCALTEEVGELAKAIMDEPSINVVNEAVQVAVMAIRIATEGDPSLDRIRFQRGQEPHGVSLDTKGIQ